MTSKEVEDRFEAHCSELRKIIEQDIDSYWNLMKEDRGFKKNLRNAERQLKKLNKLIATRKKGQTIV